MSFHHHQRHRHRHRHDDDESTPLIVDDPNHTYMDDIEEEKEGQHVTKSTYITKNDDNDDFKQKSFLSKNQFLFSSVFLLLISFCGIFNLLNNTNSIKNNNNGSILNNNQMDIVNHDSSFVTEKIYIDTSVDTQLDTHKTEKTDIETTERTTIYDQLMTLQSQIKGKVFINNNSDDKKHQYQQGIVYDPSVRSSSSSLPGMTATTSMTTFQNASHVWNQVTLPPLAVIEVYDEDDIVTALPYLIKFQKEYNVPFRIRSGGHQYAGWSGIEKGIIVSLSSSKSFNSIHDFDERNGIATIGPAVRVKEMLQELLVKRGYGSTVGICATVGEGGYSLGGGMGFVARQRGIGLDNIVAARIILANGTIIEANNEGGEGDDEEKEELQSELFWALRGAGQGNFGIVTQIKYQFYPYPDKILMLGGRATFDIVPKVMYNLVDMERNLPGSIGGFFMMESKDTDYGLFFWYNGETEEDILSNGTHLLEETASALKESSLSSFDNNKNDNNISFDPIKLNSWSEFSINQVPGHDGHLVHVWNGYFFRKQNSLSNWNVIMDHLINAVKIATEYGFIGIELWGGNIANKSSSDTPFYWRQGILNVRFTLLVPTSIPNAREVYQQDVIKVQKYWNIVEEYLDGTYTNYAQADLVGMKALRRTYGGNLERLVALKQKVDPMNVFHHPHSIPVSLG